MIYIKTFVFSNTQTCIHVGISQNLQLRQFISVPIKTRTFPLFDKSSLYASNVIAAIVRIYLQSIIFTTINQIMGVQQLKTIYTCILKVPATKTFCIIYICFKNPFQMWAHNFFSRCVKS